MRNILSKEKITLAFIFLLGLGAMVGVGVGQEKSQPLSKKEVLLLIKRAREHRLTQADIASEVDRRGIAFPVDERTLSELRRAGAHSFLIGAIERAGEAARRPRLQRPEATGGGRSPEELQRQARARALAQMPLLEQARQHALEYVENLPNFIVTQVVSRYVQFPGKRDWQLQDTLEVELTYRIDSGESFKLLRINGAATRQSYEELGGSTSTGEFGSLLAALFARQSQATFKKVGREQFRRRTTEVYDFKVQTAHSLSHIMDKNSGRSVVSGYSGSVWIDVDSKRVLRIEQSHDDIPPGFPVTLAENAVEYDWVSIGGQRYLLPVRAEVLLGRDRDRFYSRNVIEFRNYRKFETELEILPENPPQ